MRQFLEEKNASDSSHPVMSTKRLLGSITCDSEYEVNFVEVNVFTRRFNVKMQRTSLDFVWRKKYLTMEDIQKSVESLKMDRHTDCKYA